MNRRAVLTGLAAIATVPVAGYFAFSKRNLGDTKQITGSGVTRINKTEAEWRDILNPQEFAVLREGATERPNSSELNAEKRPGTFVCAGCDLPLFKSEWKFGSGTGWPSFYDYIKGHLETSADYKLVVPRTEYHCARCGGHQGHVFDDGPPPTGERWRNNGVALKFVLA
ncbi:peptide-methionine (R)-S-oxide reductase MsrB [Spectribacter hydrogenoxidans]|uniref:peptide-methionine (R)-S-oxide reductase n=1 Tax=Spectribacter hydrogenoxidans TaxID=3075608 RepID=A0ABU3C3G5_9GAMM|nr:peptide-methionine (R)-S-oxide reductase MsrB [Salinisphaera sp. W335]MDT0635931.1 peptide-methionine (R)-S-oxide reductase MsrB [Salinisphaera sp. W335]